MTDVIFPVGGGPKVPCHEADCPDCGDHWMEWADCPPTECDTCRSPNLRVITYPVTLCAACGARSGYCEHTSRMANDADGTEEDQCGGSSASS